MTNIANELVLTRLIDAPRTDQLAALAKTN
jgi:hypothetical protein